LPLGAQKMKHDPWGWIGSEKSFLEPVRSAHTSALGSASHRNGPVIRLPGLHARIIIGPHSRVETSIASERIPMKRIAASLTFLVLAVLMIQMQLSSVAAWGDEGHRYINRVAADKLPGDMPAFFRDSAARLSYLGPEPDRWRDTRGGLAALAGQNAPDHFIDIDSPESFEAIPNDRYQYSEWLRAKGKDSKTIGFLPYSILEGYEKVLVLFRLWRDPKHAAERADIEQNIVYSAGVMGHYVADASQPLHVTIHYNGWTTSYNPESFTREPLHGRFEGEYVRANIKPEDFSGMVSGSHVLKDPFSEIMKYL